MLPSPSGELAFAQGGIVDAILIQPGERVDSGEVIARLVGVETVRAELAAAQLEQTLAQQSLDALRRNALLSAAEAQQALKRAQKTYETAEGRWSVGDKEKAADLETGAGRIRGSRTGLPRLPRGTRPLRLQGPRRLQTPEDAGDLRPRKGEPGRGLRRPVGGKIPASAALVDEKQADLLQAIAALELARQQVERLDQGLDRETLLAAELRLAATQANVQAAEAALDFYELRAPFGGVLLRLDLTVGETASPGLPVAFLADISRWTIETKDLAEIDIARVRLGQSVIVKLDAFPGEEFQAQVSAIDAVGREYLGDMTYRVTVTLDEPDPRFLWNMTATVTIETP